jgi:hypothetical protein
VSDGPEWFAPKRYGYGAGLPISWQGWAVFGGYLILLGCAGFLIPRTLIGYVSVMTILTVVFIVIVARTTKGGWRWRWGDEEDPD